MQLKDFMYYPDLGCQLAMIRTYEWSGRKSVAGQQTFIKQVWFIIGAVNLFYQNLGLVTDLCLAETQEMQLAVLIAQISETCSVLGLTLVGASYMWMLLHHRTDIETMLDQLQQLYSHQRRLYRIEHYYLKSSQLMKYTTIFFLFAYTFYNSLPVIGLIYNLYADSQHIIYKTQSNTWYPWQLFVTENSMPSFVASYLCQAVASLSGVAVIMTSQFLLCFFTTQMQMHFDALAHEFNTLDARQPDANEQLKEMIAYHCHLLHIANDINRIFNFMFLSTFATSTIAICLMGFAMVMIDLAAAFKYSVGLLSFLVFTIFICYNGTQFTTTSDKLMLAAFYNNWYEGDRNYRRMILFFIMRSRESRVLRTYNFTPVSMATYMAMLKFSYQLFTFFRAMIK
ncbi:putative odorant receptor 69a [Drosophila innubila]|uniref:putative odorant receptor 69a n=1 Tax=Drosophila innubila TaxID=198719 RepID=UPI00148E0055|nr:putative odorant receptor 69a [Drosophila innubila]